MKYSVSIDALLFVTPATLAPIVTALKTVTLWNWQTILVVVISCLTGFAASLAAYRSTKFAETKFTLTEKPTPPAA